MPLFEGLSFGGGEKIAIVIDVGTAYSKWVPVHYFERYRIIHTKYIIFSERYLQQ